MQKAFLLSTDRTVEVSLPSDWKVLTIADFGPSAPRGAPETLAMEALRNPVGAPPLEGRLTAAQTVAIMIEDLTRTSPKQVLLKVLLNLLAGIGIPRRQICIVIALGTHRPLSRPELEAVFGKETVSAYEFINHDCHGDDLAPVGRLESGARVKINRRVHDADFRIGIGSIFPHPLNGFGGGGKILFPGVANFDAIVEHHLRHSFRGKACLGNVAGNPFYKEVTTMAQAGGLDFIINSVLDHTDSLYGVVCGDPVEAHLAGIEICRRIVSRRFPAPADVTLISAFPYTEGPQIVKPLAPAEQITRKGGSILLRADCTLPLPEFYFAGCERFRARFGDDLRGAVLDHFAHNRCILADAPPELNMSMAMAMLALDDFDVVLITRDIPADQVARLGFRHAPDMAAAIAMIAGEHDNPTVHIVPSGGVILPVVEGK